jgi:hypothetical protein
MAELTQITNHVRRAILNLPPNLVGMPRTMSVLRAICEEIQESEDRLWEVLTARLLENADATRLRVLGALVGQVDQGYDEDTYRELIRARAIANRSNGTVNDLLELFAIFYDSTDWKEPKPATFSLEGESSNGLPISSVRELMNAGKSAGVSLEMTVAETTGLRWSDAAATTDPTGGAGDEADADIGGKTWGVVP